MDKKSAQKVGVVGDLGDVLEDHDCFYLALFMLLLCAFARSHEAV